MIYDWIFVGIVLGIIIGVVVDYILFRIWHRKYRLILEILFKKHLDDFKNEEGDIK